MEKENLLRNIAETRNDVNRLQSIYSHLNSLYKSSIQLGCIGHVVAFIVYWSLGVWLLSFILKIFSFLDVILYALLSEAILDSIATIIAYILIFGVAFSYPYVFNQINKKRMKKNAEIAKSGEAQKLELEKQAFIDKIQNNSVIPVDYCYTKALNAFERYLLNQRADNLKECINLYEQERRHEEQIQEIKLMQQLQEKTYEKANEATTIGWINLLTRR